MDIITALRPGPGRSPRVTVLLASGARFSLDAELAAAEGLGAGQKIATVRIEELILADKLYRVRNAALRYLIYRPRSEQEVRARLSRRGFADNDIQTVITRLKEQGVLDDAAFSQFWKDNRQAFRPRSQYLTRRELRQKGVAEELISQTVADIDDDENAYRAVQKKAAVLSAADYPEFRHRLGDYLRRRGFSYEVVNRTLRRLWQERTGTGQAV